MQTVQHSSCLPASRRHLSIVYLSAFPGVPFARFDRLGCRVGTVPCGMLVTLENDMFPWMQRRCN